MDFSQYFPWSYLLKRIPENKLRTGISKFIYFKGKLELTHIFYQIISDYGKY
jgi:hypothetical protein